MTDKSKIVVISGPTGVGKSVLAVELAEAISGEIINLDSVQVYRELEIGAAKPAPELRARVPHHLFDCVSISDHFDVGSYRTLAVSAVEGVRARGKVPILCGGSTMYLTVLLHGLMSTALSSERPTFPRSSERTTGELYEELQRKDPVRASQLHPNDRQRIGRAIDLLNSGVIPSQVAQAHGFASSDFAALMLVKTASREEINSRIDLRAAHMVDGGIIEETRKLFAEFGHVRPLSSLGYRQVLEWDGDSKELLVSSIATATRQYAKRQTTFWRNEPSKRGWRSSKVTIGENDMLSRASSLFADWTNHREDGQQLVILESSASGQLP